MAIISSALNAGRQASWIANAYFVTSTSFQLLYGRLSDVWSRKYVLLAGLLIFFLGSLAASLAQDAMQLIIFRAFTGIGGGGLFTVAQIIVSRCTLMGALSIIECHPSIDIGVLAGQRCCYAKGAREVPGNIGMIPNFHCWKRYHGFSDFEAGIGCRCCSFKWSGSRHWWRHSFPIR